MQIAGHTLSVAAACRRSSRQSKPSRSQSFISFAALRERKTMVDIFFSSLPDRTIRMPDSEAELLGALSAQLRMPSVSLPTPEFGTGKKEPCPGAILPSEEKRM